MSHFGSNELGILAATESEASASLCWGVVAEAAAAVLADGW